MKNSALRNSAGPSSSYSYAQLLERGVEGLRFREPLEIEYRQLHLARYRNRVRLWQPFLVTPD